MEKLVDVYRRLQRRRRRRLSSTSAKLEVWILTDDHRFHPKHLLQTLFECPKKFVRVIDKSKHCNLVIIIRHLSMKVPNVEFSFYAHVEIDNIRYYSMQMRILLLILT